MHAIDNLSNQLAAIYVTVMDEYILLFRKCINLRRVFEVHLLEVLLQVECFSLIKFYLCVCMEFNWFPQLPKSKDF